MNVQGYKPGSRLKGTTWQRAPRPKYTQYFPFLLANGLVQWATLSAKGAHQIRCLPDLSFLQLQIYLVRSTTSTALHYGGVLKDASGAYDKHRATL